MKKKYYKDLKEGDKVRVKKHLKERLSCMKGISDFCGKKVTIKSINEGGLSVGVEETPWYFSRGMLKNPKKYKCAPSFAEVLFGDNHSVEKTPGGYMHTWTYEKPPVEVPLEVPSPITETKKGYRYYTKLRDKINEIVTYLEDKK